jgi:hypothetical protein
VARAGAAGRAHPGAQRPALGIPRPPGEWETAGREQATAILFWIPRDLRTLPGFTTNVEFGLDVTTGRAVLGCPPDCPNPERNRYLIWLARRHSVPVSDTLTATVASALALCSQPRQEAD